MNLERLRAQRMQSGFNKYVDMVLTETKEGYAEGEILLQEKHLNPVGNVHGGLTFALMDTVGGTCAMTRGHFVTTSGSSISYLNRAKPGAKKLKAIAREVKWGHSLIVVDVDAYDDFNNHMAHATFTFFTLQPIDEMV